MGNGSSKLNIEKETLAYRHNLTFKTDVINIHETWVLKCFVFMFSSNYYQIYILYQ